ncbi:hypothetical protein ACFLRF_05595 [Candidatus Altiarchaeota archaeon]
MIATIETVVLIYWGALIYSFSFIGASLKYIDQVYDEGIYNRRIAHLLSVITGLMMGILITFNPAAAIILLAIIIAVGITQKLDNLPFQITALLAIGIPAMITALPVFPGYEFTLAWVPLFMLTVAGFLDEYLDGYGDKTKKWILTIRPTMKLMMLALVFMGTFHIIYFIAFLSFDFSYITVHWLSNKEIKAKKKLKKKKTKKH